MTHRHAQNARPGPSASGAGYPSAHLPELPEPPCLDPRLPEPEPVPSERAAEYRRHGLAYTIPVALIAPVVVLTWIGAWLDGRLGGASSGWTLGGAIVGIVVGMLNMARLAARLSK
jgi:hypothetical protein